MRLSSNTHYIPDPFAAAAVVALVAATNFSVSLIEFLEIGDARRWMKRGMSMGGGGNGRPADLLSGTTYWKRSVFGADHCCRDPSWMPHVIDDVMRRRTGSRRAVNSPSVLRNDSGLSVIDARQHRPRLCHRPLASQDRAVSRICWRPRIIPFPGLGSTLEYALSRHEQPAARGLSGAQRVITAITDSAKGAAVNLRTAEIRLVLDMRFARAR
jgi:hypothetical protein